MDDIMADSSGGEDDASPSARPPSDAVHDHCRLCANVGDSMVPIYADEGADHGLEIKIKTHLPFLNICVDDPLPKRICYHCASAVLVWDELFEFSTVADSKLRNWFDGRHPYDQRECKTVSYDVMGGLSAETVEFEDISDVNIFGRNEKSVNDLDKISNCSKSISLLSDELKADIIEQDESLASDLKRYMTESDESLRNFTAKETSLTKYYSCSFCTEIFVKIRDKVKHERVFHGCQSNVLSVKYFSDRYTDDVGFDDGGEKNVTVQNYTNMDGLNEKDIPNNLFCIVCNISFETDIEKQNHSKKFHGLQVVNEQNLPAISQSYGELFNEESNLDLLTPNNILSTEQFDDRCAQTEAVDHATNDDSVLLLKQEVQIKDDCALPDDYLDNKNMCFYCGCVFSSKTDYLNHSTCSPVPEPKKEDKKVDIYDKYKVMVNDKLFYKCDQCKYAVEGRRYKFVYHMRVHTGEKPYTCEICSKQFRTAAFLRRHIVCFHDKVRGYQCDICGRSFSEKRNVEDHRRTHTGERPFICETCGKSFAQRSSMKIHWKQMHESIKAHKCQYCDKSFIRKCHLVAHLTHHTGVRNYVCAVCGKAFLRSGTLKGHTAVHSLERPFTCTICGDSFKLKKHLKQHGRVHNEARFFNRAAELESASADNPPRK